MKTIFLSKMVVVILFSLITTHTQSQEIDKRENVYTLKQMGSTVASLTAHRVYVKDSLINIYVHLIGYDHAYPAAQEYITLYSGSIPEFNSFLNDVIKFYDQEPGTSTTVNNEKTFINVEKQMGMKGIYIHDEKVSYTVFTQKQLFLIRDNFYNWTNKNKINLTE